MSNIVFFNCISIRYTNATDSNTEGAKAKRVAVIRAFR